MKKKEMYLGMLFVVGFAFAGCAGLSGIFNPITAIDAAGNKFPASHGFSNNVKIDGVEYTSRVRPAVPGAPKKPVEPTKPVPPTWFNNTIRVGTDINGEKYHTEESFASKAEAIEKFNFYNSLANKDGLSPAARSHISEVARAFSNAIAFFERQQRQYDSALAQYQINLPRYQQDYARYEQEMAEYNKKLPEYQAAVDAECKAIQESINAEAPGHWERYVEGKYLLYRGKL